MSEEIDIRVTTLEVEVGHMQETQLEAISTMRSMNEKIDALTSRMDKQNGAIPHMQADLASISQQLMAMNLNTTNQQTLNHAQQVMAAEDKGKLNTKVKVLWGVLGLLATGLVGLAVKLVLGI